MAPPVTPPRGIVSRCGAFFDLQERTWRVADQRATGLPAIGVGLVGLQGHVASLDSLKCRRTTVGLPLVPALGLENSVVIFKHKKKLKS